MDSVSPACRRQLRLGYLYIFFFNLFFWYGAWLVLFLRYINYVELGIIQSVALLTTVLFEIPTGAVTDIIGKRRALLLSCALILVGELLVPLFPSFAIFLVSNIIIRLGLSFYSGTMDAFMYDTLASARATSQHSHVLSRMSMYSTLAIGLASIIGGALFLLYPAFPWYLTAIAKFICLIIALFMVEPVVDTVKVSLSQLIPQLLTGFHHLFSSKLFWLSIFIVSFGIFSKINYEILDDTNVVEFGLNSSQIGLFYSFLLLVSLPVSAYYHRLQTIFTPLTLMIVSMLLYGLVLALVPLVGLPLFLLLVSFRGSVSPLRTNSISQIINQYTPSSIRATTLSTLELINSLPFVLISIPLGGLMQQYSARVVTGVTGLLIITVLLLQLPHLVKMYSRYSP